MKRGFLVLGLLFVTALASAKEPEPSESRRGAGAEASAFPDVDAATYPGAGYPRTGSSMLAPEQHIVRIQRQGRTLGVGVSLATGRVLTSLTVVGSGRGLSATFTDGEAAPLRVYRTHRAFDLALLLVESDVLRLGLELSAQSDYERALSWTTAEPKTVSFEPLEIRRALGTDDVELSDVVVSRGEWPLGTAIVDSAGRLSAIAIQACVPVKPEASNAPCRERDVALPARLVGKFLESAGSGDTEGWLGVRAELSDSGWVRGLRVVSVEAGSPAQAVGMESAGADPGSGDVLVALNGVPLGTPQRLARMIESLVPGTEVELLLVRAGRFQSLRVKLGAQPTREKAWQLNPPLIQPPSPWLGF